MHIAGIETEQPNLRPRCGYKPSTDGKPCGSEEDLSIVKGRGKYGGGPKETPVCAKHRTDVWRVWDIDRIDPL